MDRQEFNEGKGCAIWIVRVILVLFTVTMMFLLSCSKKSTCDAYHTGNPHQKQKRK